MDCFLRQKLFVLSGLLNSEADKIVRILNNRDANILKRWEAEETWQTILGSNS
jgi:ribosomal protein L11 methyltransferase